MNCKKPHTWITEGAPASDKYIARFICKRCRCLGFRPVGVRDVVRPYQNQAAARQHLLEHTGVLATQECPRMFMGHSDEDE